MRSIYFYKVDKDFIICCKKIGNTINFIDVKTDGIEISYTIEKNFSKKNIKSLLKIKFKEWELIEK